MRENGKIINPMETVSSYIQIIATLMANSEMV
jgi:hypothetical protein